MTKYDTSPLAGIGVVGWADLCQLFAPLPLPLYRLAPAESHLSTRHGTIGHADASSAFGWRCARWKSQT